MIDGYNDAIREIYQNGDWDDDGSEWELTGEKPRSCETQAAMMDGCA